MTPLKFNLFLWCKAEISAAITAVFNVTWSFEKSFYIIILLLVFLDTVDLFLNLSF